MDDDQEISGVAVLRVFPLAGVVLFPHAILPLHIFEPRYRQMTEDALEDDRLIAIVMTRPGGSNPAGLEEYGCVGRIFKHERLPDGRFNFLLVGLRRVRMIREVPSDKLYRTVEAEIVEDLIDDVVDADTSRDNLLALFRRYLTHFEVEAPELEATLTGDLPLGVVADILAHAVQMPPALKQQLLAERETERRVESLKAWLLVVLQVAEAQPGTATFPPPFSSN